MDGRKVSLVCFAAYLMFTTLGCSRKEVRSPLQPAIPSGTQPVSGVPMQQTTRKPFWDRSSTPQPVTPVEPIAQERKDGPLEPETIVAFAEVQLEAALDKNTPPSNREKLLDKARQNYQKALEQDPKCKSALLGLARFYSRLGETARAVEIYKQYLTIYPTDRDVAHEVAMAHARWQDWAGAVAWCKFTLSIDPENLSARKTMAFCLTREGKWEEAYHVMCEIMPEAQARYLMARALEHQGQPQRCRQQLLLALQADPNYTAAREFLTELDAVLAGATQPPPALRQVEHRDQP